MAEHLATNSIRTSGREGARSRQRVGEASSWRYSGARSQFQPSGGHRPKAYPGRTFSHRAHQSPAWGFCARVGRSRSHRTPRHQRTVLAEAEVSECKHVPPIKQRFRTRLSGSGYRPRFWYPASMHARQLVNRWRQKDARLSSAPPQQIHSAPDPGGAISAGCALIATPPAQWCAATKEIDDWPAGRVYSGERTTN